MSDLERDLRDELARRADAVAPEPADWDDLTSRMARRDRRTRAWLAVGLVVALVGGPLAGFAVARAVQDDEPGARVTADGGAGGARGAVSTSEQAALRAEAGGAALLGPSGPVEKVFRRVTSDGVTVRAFTTPTPISCQGDGWCPPPDCYPDAQITGQLSTEEAVGLAWGSHYGGTPPALRVSGGGSFGGNGEGSPARWVVAQAGPDVKAVRVSFEGGGRDEMTPVDGTVLLAARADTTKVGGKVEALDGSGAVVDTKDLTTADGVFVAPGAIGYERLALLTVDPATLTTTAPPGTTEGEPVTTVAPEAADARCTPPPPSLPAPGEQPADPEAARAAVTSAFVAAYNGGVGADEEKRAAVEDGESLRGTMDEVRNGSFAQQAKDATAVVTEIVFTSPTEAAVRYDIKIANYTDFDGRIGKAVFVDGRWKVARVTVCADLALAGGTCP